MADDFLASTSTTGQVAVRGTTTGQLEVVGDKDWFAVTLSAGKQYTFTLDPGTTNSLQDPYLRLFSIGGTTMLAESDDANGLGSQIDYLAMTTGTYYLEASSGTNPDSPAVGTRMGNYIVSFSTSGDDYAGNATTIGTVSSGESAIGQLETTADSDWFAIHLEAGKIYDFTLDASETNGLSDPLLKLYKSDGSLITENDDASGLNSQIVYTAPATGTYYLGAAAGKNGDGTGTYNLNASLPISDDYLATIKTTGQVVPGSSTSGQLEYRGDSDWFTMNLTVGQQYTFSLNSGTTNGLADPFLSLYNRSGTLISSDDDSNAPNASLTYTATETGAYYLGASSSPQNTSAATGSYSISSSLPSINGVTIISGTSANDTITTSSNDESIDGGAGIDRVDFSSSLANATILLTTTGFTITDSAGTAGADTLTNVESLKFADGAILVAADLTSKTPDGSAPRALSQFTDAIGQRMEQFYLAYYGRSADYGGLVYWKQTLASALSNDQTKMVGYFGNAQQTEFVNLYGTSNDNTAFLNAVYRNLFSHGPDTAGLNYWLGVIDSSVAAGTRLEAARANAVIYIMDGAQGDDIAIVNAKVASMTTISRQIATFDHSNVFGDANNTSAFDVLRNWTQGQLAGAAAPDLVLKAVGEKSIANAAFGGNEVQISASFTLLDGFANLKLTGAASLTGTGNAADNLIYGNAAGSTLTGGDGKDCFIVSALTSKPDGVADFTAEDLIAVDTTGFSGLTSGVQSVQVYGNQTGTKATLVYDQASGTLYYDADGAGSQAPQAILTLAGAPSLGAESVWGI